MNGIVDSVPIDESRAPSARARERDRPDDARCAASVTPRSPKSESPARLSRRYVLRSLVAASVALVPALGPGGAGALRRWCRVDPIFKIEGQAAHVWVSAYVKNRRQARALATGPTKLVLAVPVGTKVRHVASDNGFGYGYEISVEEAADLDGTGPILPVRVTVTVPMAASNVAVRAEFVPRRAKKGRLRRGSGEGMANAEVVVFAPS